MKTDYFFIVLPNAVSIPPSGSKTFKHEPKTRHPVFDTSNWGWKEMLDEIAAQAKQEQLDREKRRQARIEDQKREEEMWASIGPM